ncbi:MAG TPA: asparagine synthetase B [Stellaceae bacterium]|nr:asparagine synthetase B [Stellaceae bacterium]
MLAAQQLYGPHGAAQWSGGDIAVGRRLFQLLPEDLLDRQPLSSSDGRFVLVADVRLDNREELFGALNIAAPHAAQMSDAALLLAAIERWDESSLDRVVGDYAFALWEGARRRLRLARDPLGERPLHYHSGKGFFAFASMPKGLHALAEVPVEADEDWIAEFLALLPLQGSRTCFRRIERVQPGHIVTIGENAVATRRFWQPRPRPLGYRRHEDYVERLRELLDEAVRCRLRGTQDVGAHLSGGLDSSAVTTTAAKLLAASGRRVVAFTGVPRAGYEGPSPSGRIIDEYDQAAATAAMYPNIDHVPVRNPDGSPLDYLDRNLLLFDQPSPAISNSGLFQAINDAARARKLSVMLTGAYGNRGFSYRGVTALPELVRKGHGVRWWRTANALVRNSGWSWPHAIAQTLGAWFPAGAWLWLLRTRRGQHCDLRDYCAIRADRVAELDLPRRARKRRWDLAFRPLSDGYAERLLWLGEADGGCYYKGTLAGSQIDERNPLADRRLLEFCIAVPTEEFVAGGMPRALARHALADRAPRSVTATLGRGLQSADWHVQLTAARPQLASELKRLQAYPTVARLLDMERLQHLIDDWPAGGWERGDIVAQYRTSLLCSVAAGHFLRRAAGGNS